MIGVDRMEMKKTKIYRLTLIGVMTAMLCVLGPLSIPIPFSPIPLSLTNFAVLLTVSVLDWKWGTVSCAVYLLLGAVGVPVFSGFAGGVAKLLGPTGGYLIGFLFLAVIGGIFMERFEGKRWLVALGMALGMLVDSLFGTVWLAYLMKLDFAQAFMMGVAPYIVGDLVKLVIAVLLGGTLRRRLKTMRILP